MEIGQQGESVEDSILKNLSETRDLWKSQESNQNTKMLQPKSKQYDQIKVEDVGSSSETESESESEAIVPSGMLPFLLMLPSQVLPFQEFG